MKILVVSDTHNSRDALSRILDISKNFDVIFHLGDNIADGHYLNKEFNGEVYRVKGNCDYGQEGDNELLVNLENKRFFLTHGDRYGVNYGLDKLYYRGLELEADCILYGHTHRKVNICENNLRIVNPGSIPLPRDGSSSYAIIDINNDKLTINLIEI